MTRLEGRIRFEVRLTPNAGRDEVSGLGEDADGKPHLKIRVTAIPEKGKANKALIALLSKSLRVPKGAIAIVSGETNRVKTLEIEGQPAEIETALNELVAG
ncbi:DUF167 domain-containing protein [Pseudohoeflea suaedae]|uniref:UPF0235 protein E2A64_00925 n=1 Tax=Pseudohoeflea suaedae TaxID=877384 RepID=A0A4R5PLN1_9HYPH|nr:DUF167 family protein [Pseudohoeflea suaedae]TDH37738.1 DUF167 domain-containing protein [Pseudohoeflea suaedae]